MVTQAVSLTPGENDLIRRCLVYARDDVSLSAGGVSESCLVLALDSTVAILNDLIDRLSLAEVRSRREQVLLEAMSDDRHPY